MWAFQVSAAVTLLLTLLFLWRHRLSAHALSAIVALGFGCAMAYSVWRVEWFDVYRHGMPSATYFLKTVVAYSGVLAITGWFVGLVLARIPTLG